MAIPHDIVKKKIFLEFYFIFAKMDKKKTKKSKHGKKNWRKNIDVSEIEKAKVKKNREDIIEKNVEKLKDEDIFDYDIAPDDKNKILGKKVERTKPKKVKKKSKNEQRQIKRIVEREMEKKEEEPEEKKQEVFDIWGDDNTKSEKPNKRQISYPAVPIAHPGQSYNPDKKDLNNLLHKVVDLNKHLVKEEKKEDSTEIRNLYESDEESEDLPLANPVSNNPKVDDTNRKTRKEKRLKEIKKKNILKDKEDLRKKKARLDLHNSMSTKQVLKEQKKTEEMKKKEKKEKMLEEKKKQSMLKNGIIEDKELLEDFEVKKEPVPLRKIKSNTNFLKDRFNNVIKRNVLGDLPERNNKQNRKLKRVKYLDLNGASLDYNPDEGLKIIE